MVKIYNSSLMVLVKEGLKMKKHLSLDERFDIENSLCKGLSFKEIARNIGKDCTTISREIRNHYIVKNTGGIGRQFNNCIYRTTCPNKGKNCKLSSCAEFVEEKCSLLNKPPYVCNGCKLKTQCTLSKNFYSFPSYPFQNFSCHFIFQKIKNSITHFSFRSSFQKNSSLTLKNFTTLNFNFVSIHNKTQN